MKSITAAQLAERHGAPLIDVREPHEFAGGHVPGAVNIPMREVLDRIDELPDGEFAVICELGGRSARVVQALEARGYDAANVEGGTAEWVAQGRAVETPASPQTP
ncbi:rhodanese-like domain-containing protein [Microbacterium pseudoresistens]|uniref:Rhodanese-related sulfurtransferase n=1 Tax=Microbacterium pseudoresistens TaxID=640634 RepID=A0A7Y9EUY8_9MICO|nr:rhodanese-like domain-containing protein [Microbacterium pseudoresistens]NYD53540.1 rhodanese-related sulfurtransferase [Microbacterium pseudoresistens]